jgi:hypothetical protein
VKYVKLTRVGDTFSAFYSTNGTTWNSVASPVTISMSSSLKAGLCDSSANASSATSAAFVGASVVVDNTPPTLVSDGYLSTALNKLSFTFSEDVSASLSTTSLNVITVPGGASINVSSMSYNTATNTATFTLATPLADGNYLATLTGPGTTDPVGNSLVGGDVQLPFFVLPGDANRDGIVNAVDFNALASNFGSAGGLSSGDFDFNGTINSGDFNVLAANFNTNVTPHPSPALGTIASSPSLFSSVTLADENRDVLALAGNAGN